MLPRLFGQEVEPTVHFDQRVTWNENQNTVLQLKLEFAKQSIRD